MRRSRVRISVLAPNMVEIAQLVEHQIVTLGVAGSIPVLHPINLAWLVYQPSEPACDTPANVNWHETTDEDLCLV